MKYHELVEEVAKFDIKAANYMLTREDLFLKAAPSIRCVFVWKNTPQGHKYWETLYFKMKKPHE